MTQGLRVRLFNFVSCLSDALDLVSPSMVNHHEQVAYIAFSLASELGLSTKERNELLLAGALHDAGALSLKDKLSTLKFEMSSPNPHAEVGYLLLSSFSPLGHIADLVRYHHEDWNGEKSVRKVVPAGSHLLHLADRIAVSVGRRKDVLSHARGIRRKIRQFAGTKFSPEYVDVFEGLAEKEHFWLDLTSPAIKSTLDHMASSSLYELDMKGILDFAHLFCRIMDFRSSFTATHSSGVAASAEKLGSLAGLSDDGCMVMKISGYLHDLGKLAVPKEILEKPSRLGRRERNIIKSHTYHTFHTLDSVAELSDIAICASFHHERLNGKGYPFHAEASGIPASARIMAVADVFTALSEDRPYRRGLRRKEVMNILRGMVRDMSLDGDIVEQLCRSYDEIHYVRAEAQRGALHQYRNTFHT